MRNDTQYKYLLPVLLLLISCAEKAPCESLPMFNHSASFWLGLWHGFILLFSFLGKVFNLNIGIQEVHFTGFNYRLGYIIGLWLFLKTIALIATHRDKT